MSLAGKRLIVIGGTSGIGFAIAAAARELGADVIVASSHRTHVDAALQRLPGASGDVVDLRDEASVSRFFDMHGAFDHLSITAGDWESMASARKPVLELDLAEARGSLDVRFWGALAAIKHGSRHIAPNGSITLTGGMLAHRPWKGAPLLTAMAGAIEYLTRGLAVDLAPVRVNAVCPGLTLTEPVAQMPAEVVQASVSRLLVPRGATPMEAAKPYLYLMLNDYVTGQTLPVDGGGLLV
ncbi:SDR family oxidoreductase [Pararobbsia silviterrae]|uniref:SDR family oxidoreductase n=2 Tax=Pararobbsia silviterrae TaxID=1792498 RepID=A0A494XM66_9BURK|nr:SDR family oxidoreductase [Pararobbsia silviterrae]